MCWCLTATLGSYPYWYFHSLSDGHTPGDVDGAGTVSSTTKDEPCTKAGCSSVASATATACHSYCAKSGGRRGVSDAARAERRNSSIKATARAPTIAAKTNELSRADPLMSQVANAPR